MKGLCVLKIIRIIVTVFTAFELLIRSTFISIVAFAGKAEFQYCLKLKFLDCVLDRFGCCISTLVNLKIPYDNLNLSSWLR